MSLGRVKQQSRVGLLLEFIFQLELRVLLESLGDLLTAEDKGKEARHSSQNFDSSALHSTGILTINV